MMALIRAIVLTMVFSGAALAGPLEDAFVAWRQGDWALAARLLRPLAGEGDASAQVYLGFAYAVGRGVSQDYVEAVRWFRRAADQDDERGQFCLGLAYDEGMGVVQDLEEAAKWFRRAADRDRLSATVYLDDALLEGKGVPGRAGAQVSLGLAYERGRGVPQDYAEAVKWFRRAAEQGDADAQNHLGFAYRDGHGVPTDYAEAVRWFRRAAEQGNARAQSSLGFAYDVGQGVPQDYAEAAKWLRRAADQGDAYAQRNLGRAYDRGRGVPQDIVKAYMWLSLAAAREFDYAKLRDQIGGKLTPVQIAEAQRLAREWRPTRLDTSRLTPVDYDPFADPVPAGPGASATTVPNRSSAGPKAEPPPKLSGTGTGLFTTRDGHVLTNAHVVDGCREIRVRSPSAGATPATLVAVTKRDDLALVKAAGSAAEPARFRTGEPPRLGDSVVVFGFPLSGALASSGNLTTGAISALAGIADDPSMYQITAPVQPGNSGGPLLDASGNVVGVVVTKLDAVRVARITGDIPQNVNFAIKATLALSFLEAHGIRPAIDASRATLTPADIGASARKFTVAVECFK